MPATWKKVIVSGSNAELNQITASGGVNATLPSTQQANFVTYNSASGQEFLNTLDTSQITMIWPYIDSDAWQKKFHDYSADQEYAKEILKQAGW